MKTEVVMRRLLFGSEISQKSKSEFFSATDIVRAGNKWRAENGLTPFNISAWFSKKATVEFIEELQMKYGSAYIKGRGRNAHTWVHPLLFIDLALAINPRLKLEVYEWLFDHLIQFRNDSGDSYKEMCGYLYARHREAKSFGRYITKVATEIKKVCDVSDWQSATEEQLALRDKIQKEIAVLADVMNNNDVAVSLAIKRNVKGME